MRLPDKERLRKAFEGLENDSIYTRFFHHRKHLTGDELRRLTWPSRWRRISTAWDALRLTFELA